MVLQINSLRCMLVFESTAMQLWHIHINKRISYVDVYYLGTLQQLQQQNLQKS